MSSSLTQRFLRFAPAPIRRRSEARSLGAVPLLTFDPAHLAARSDVHLDEILRSDSIAAGWENANALREVAPPDGTGGVNPGDRRALFHLAAGIGARSVLEIGTHIGASTTNLATAIAESAAVGPGAAPRLVTVDIADVNDEAGEPWRLYGADRSPREMVSTLGLGDITTFVVSPSLEFMAECDERFDLIFLDGDHSARAVYSEIAAALPLLHEGGLIVLHDYFPDLKPLWSNGVVIDGPFLGAKRMIDEGAPIAVLPLGELPWPTKLGSHTTSLAVLVRESQE